MSTTKSADDAAPYPDVLVMGRIQRHGTAHIAEQLQSKRSTARGNGVGWHLLLRVADAFASSPADETAVQATEPASLRRR